MHIGCSRAGCGIVEGAGPVWGEGRVGGGELCCCCGGGCVVELSLRAGCSERDG